MMTPCYFAQLCNVSVCKIVQAIYQLFVQFLSYLSMDISPHSIYMAITFCEKLLKAIEAKPFQILRSNKLKLKHGLHRP